LITGASGFLGSWFLNHYITNPGPDDIWYMDIQPHPAGLPVDLQDMEAWLADFDEEVDIAFHFAAPVGGRLKIEHDPMYNADAFRLDSVFFRWAVAHAKLAVYPSSSAIYPTSLQGRSGDMLLNEGFINPSNPNWSAPDELYGFSKLAGEYMAWKAAQKHGLSTLCIRPFSGYGPGQTLDYPVPSILARAKRHEDPITIWGSGEQTRDFVYVTDIVAATMARIDQGVHGYQAMNISTGFGTPFATVAKIGAELAGYDPEITFDPSKPEGVIHRRGDNQRMLRFHEPEVSLQEGLGYVFNSLPVEVNA
jgi:GDP-L-fucose synthase